jgi:hypothetical protein
MTAPARPVGLQVLGAVLQVHDAAVEPPLVDQLEVELTSSGSARVPPPTITGTK